MKSSMVVANQVKTMYFALQIYGDVANILKLISIVNDRNTVDHNNKRVQYCGNVKLVIIKQMSVGFTKYNR